MAHDSIRAIGDRWARHTGNAPRLIETVRPMATQARLRSTQLDAVHLHANATQRQAVRVISGGFCLCASPYFVAKDGRSRSPRYCAGFGAGVSLPWCQIANVIASGVYQLNLPQTKIDFNAAGRGPKRVVECSIMYTNSKLGGYL